MLDERRFPAPIGADEGNVLSLGDFEVDVSKGGRILCSVPVGEGSGVYHMKTFSP